MTSPNEHTKHSLPGQPAFALKYCNLSLCADEYLTDIAGLLAREISVRTEKDVPVLSAVSYPCIELIADSDFGESADEFKIELSHSSVRVTGRGVRAMLFGVGLLLRKSVFGAPGELTLISDISGIHKPDKPIRGHQLGYRTCNNTYDAWNREQYRQYMLELMLFGANTVELIPYDMPKKPNSLMSRDYKTALRESCEDADRLDMDVSLWYPNDSLPIEESTAVRAEVFASMPRLNALFIPGSDPGDYCPTELFERVRAFSQAAKKHHPAVSVWVSAQAPHNSPLWGVGFIRELCKNGEGIDGVVFGPNHAFALDELRKRVPSQYPIRYYNDITHNVRCEHPVHFEKDDWHFSCACVNGRESINPRPREFARLHALTRGFVTGSCSYSEGVNDDVNKMVWSLLDNSPGANVREALCDYSRLFFPRSDAEKVADAILMLESNWDCDVALNPIIDSTLSAFRGLSVDNPSLCKSWRFNSLLLRASVDALSRKRRLFEQRLILLSLPLIKGGRLTEAESLLSTEFDSSYIELRAEIDNLAGLLFEQIGIQLDIEHYYASGWERGAMLESVDLPVTDRSRLLNALRYALMLPEEAGADLMRLCAGRADVATDEIYYSVALHGVTALGVQQKGEVYLNFKGDNPAENNGNRPMGALTYFDANIMTARFSSLTGKCDYLLQVNYADKPNRRVNHHRVCAGGAVLYDGEGYGGVTMPKRRFITPEGCVTVEYKLPASLIVFGCVDIEISEPTVGFELCELRIVKA